MVGSAVSAGMIACVVITGSTVVVGGGGATVVVGRFRRRGGWRRRAEWSWSWVWLSWLWWWWWSWSWWLWLSLWWWSSWLSWWVSVRGCRWWGRWSVVVGVIVETVGWPLLPVTVTVCGTGALDVDGPSPGLVTRVVVVAGVLSVLVRVSASPPTVNAASAAAMPNSRGGRAVPRRRRDNRRGGPARRLPRKTVGRSAVERRRVTLPRVVLAGIGHGLAGAVVVLRPGQGLSGLGRVRRAGG